MNERGTTSAKAAEVAALNTRKAKESTSATTLRATWRRESLAYGVAAPHLADLVRNPAQEAKPIATQAVVSAWAGSTVPSPAPTLHAPRLSMSSRLVEALRARPKRCQGSRMTPRSCGSPPIVIPPSKCSRSSAVHSRVRNDWQMMWPTESMRTRPPQRLKARSLSEEQHTALEHLTAAPRLSVLEGLAGTGKSYLLGAAREAWEASGYEVRAAALAGKAAKGLQEGSGIPAQTLHSLLQASKPGGIGSPIARCS